MPVRENFVDRAIVTFVNRLEQAVTGQVVFERQSLVERIVVMIERFLNQTTGTIVGPVDPILLGLTVDPESFIGPDLTALGIKRVFELRHAFVVVHDPIPCPSRPMVTFLPEPDILLDPPELPEIPLPKGWSEYTLLAVLHVIALARIIVLNVANWPTDSECDGLRLRVENDRLKGEVEMLKMEIAIKDARFSRLEPKKRPHYTPEERLEILALRAMRGWSNTQVAQRFQLTVQTIVNWMNGVESGKDSKVAFAEKPNRYPDFVRYVVQQFKSFCPMLGRNKISEILCRGETQNALRLAENVHRWKSGSKGSRASRISRKTAAFADSQSRTNLILHWFSKIGSGSRYALPAFIGRI